MKTPNLVLTLCAVGVGGALTSCVDPYSAGVYAEGPRYSETSVTHYRPGYVVQSLPSRYETEVIGGVRYYRDNDVYYRPQGSRYVVVEAPRGSRFRDDRRDYARTDYDRRGTYSRTSDYDRRDSYARPTSYDRRETRVIRTLPSGARLVTLRGSRYYQHNNVYYRPEGSGYVIVDSPY